MTVGVPYPSLIPRDCCMNPSTMAPLDDVNTLVCDCPSIRDSISRVVAERRHGCESDIQLLSLESIANMLDDANVPMDYGGCELLKELRAVRQGASSYLTTQHL